MYSYIKGTLSEIYGNCIVVEASGVGYEITATAAALNENSQIGKEVKIFVYHCVREDGVSLFGFVSKVEKSMFLRLLTVSGIGPKVAIGILSGMGINELSSAVLSNDVAKISSIKGIGKKTAERLILELKDKIDAEIGKDVNALGSMPDVVPDNNYAVMALVSLGMSKAEAISAIKRVKVTEGMTAEQVVFAALKG